MTAFKKVHNAPFSFHNSEKNGQIVYELFDVVGLRDRTSSTWMCISLRLDWRANKEKHFCSQERTEAQYYFFCEITQESRIPFHHTKPLEMTLVHSDWLLYSNVGAFTSNFVWFKPRCFLISEHWISPKVHGKSLMLFWNYHRSVRLINNSFLLFILWFFPKERKKALQVSLNETKKRLQKGRMIEISTMKITIGHICSWFFSYSFHQSWLGRLRLLHQKNQIIQGRCA